MSSDDNGRTPSHPREASSGNNGQELLQPPGWVVPRGYANGVAVRGRMVFVGGQIGWNAQCVLTANDFVGQARQALANVKAILAEAGARPDHIARLTWYVLDRREYLDSARLLGEAYREVMGRHFPAMSAVEVSALMEERARVEIEATAVIPDNDA